MTQHQCLTWPFAFRQLINDAAPKRAKLLN
jgi:hypothetical protein